MQDELFSDRIGEISLTGAVARLDLVSLSATEKDAEGKAKPVFRQRVVMPVEGFVQSFSLMAQVMQQLEKQGLVTRNQAPGDAKAAPAVMSAPQSPNFK